MSHSDASRKSEPKQDLLEQIGFRVQLTFPDLLVKEELPVRSPEHSESGKPFLKRLGGVFRIFRS